jgi:predicted glycoside hydrolase/deacetylase ChbG (UPF0249 family)
METRGAGTLIVNADDWGRDRETTDRTRDCIERGTLSSVSAMVFMTDSERAAEIACARKMDVGIHLNFTSPFTMPGPHAALSEHQARVAAYLQKHRFAQALFHPALTESFRYCVAAQVEEFARLYGITPRRYDGHHHMHLCANVVLARLLPAGTVVRRNFSFRAGDKSLMNRTYRWALDQILARSHTMTDRFFSLSPVQPVDRLQKIFAMARGLVVEVGTHPVKPEEYHFLTSEKVFKAAGDIDIAPAYIV